LPSRDKNRVHADGFDFLADVRESEDGDDFADDVAEVGLGGEVGDGDGEEVLAETVGVEGVSLDYGLVFFGWLSHHSGNRPRDNRLGYKFLPLHILLN